MRYFNNVGLIALGLSVLSLTLVGCDGKDKKGNQTNTVVTTPTDTVRPDTPKVDSVESATPVLPIVKGCMATETPFKVVNISKMETRVNMSGKQLSLNCGVKIFHNQLIEISIRPLLGVEMYRVHLTPQKFAIFDKFNKVYCESTYDYFRYEFSIPFTYEDIEALLLGRLFTFDEGVEGQAMKNSFIASATDSTYTLVGKKMVDKYTHRFEMGSNYYITKTALAGKSTDVFVVDYSDYTKVRNLQMPHTIKLLYAHGVKPSTISFSIQKMAIDDKSQPTVVDYSRYTKQNCSKILP